MLANVLDPFYQVMGSILAGIYSVVPNYAVAIFGLTCIVLAILTPLTLKGLRSTIKIQKLLPEQKKLQAQFKDDRQALNEAVMKLYKENKVSPVGGCLPFLVQSPFFIALIGVLRGMSRVHSYSASVFGRPFVDKTAVAPSSWGNYISGKAPADAIRLGLPQHIPAGSKLYKSLYGLSPKQQFPGSNLPKLNHNAGELKALGFDLARSASEMKSAGFVKFLPYLVLLVAMVGLQFLAQQQVNKRNPAAAAANPQMQAITKFMPFIFGVWGWLFQAGVTLYWTTSSALRIVQQWALYRFDPTLSESVKEKKAEFHTVVKDPKSTEAKQGKSVVRPKATGPAGKANRSDDGGAAGASTQPKPKPKAGPGPKSASQGANRPLGPQPKPATDGPKSGAMGPAAARGAGRQQPKKRRKGR